MSYIFLSYSHKNSDYARSLAESLKQSGLEVWLDDRLDYGSRWPHVIQDKLDACAAFVVIMTDNSFHSEWVQNELNRAQRKRKPIYPLPLQGNEPWLSVESTQFVDVRDRQLPPRSFYATLTQALPRRAASPRRKQPHGLPRFNPRRSKPLPWRNQTR